MKCLGTGLAKGLSWRQIEVGRDADGAPSIRLSGAAEERAAALGAARLHLSLTHTENLALAFVVAESAS